MTAARYGNYPPWISSPIRRWDDYTRARDEMFAATDTPWAPWYVAKSDDKKRVRLNIITHLLGRIPYKNGAPQKGGAPEAEERRGVQVSRFPVQVHSRCLLNQGMHCCRNELCHRLNLPE